ncbi:CASP-like protein ARALYDRAFT_485429 [Prosopis cineraria]|uniref:CASP-like protein ARALYDRAFT_485429 n=1 Tax=Prosopis cineraria TaxID=364024 RepID=UPI00240F57A0|nr:CASP-like protein ARALYDRAFT_485429 [Prosopis cineraria]
MEELRGVFGTSSSFTLRLGQAGFSAASLLFLCFHVEFYMYSAHCYSITVMSLVIPWSVTLLVVDAYSLLINCLPRQRRIIRIIFLGDLCLSYLSLAAACSTASVTDLLQHAGGSMCPIMSCNGFRWSAAMSFLCWSLLSASCLFNFWLLPSL